jgi:predicted dehydrogenase
MIKVLIVGLGSIAMKHISAIRDLVQVEIYALRSSKSTEETDGIINLYSLIELENINFTFCIVSNPTYKHRETILKLKKFKWPLFIEKPLFGDLESNDKLIIKDIEENGIKNYVACNLRFLDCLNEIKNRITQLRINEINVYAGSYLPEWRPNKDFRKIYSANKEMAGGVHLDLIHELDYMYWLFGEPFKAESFLSSKSSLSISAVDYANYRWEYPGFNSSIILNYYRRDPKRTLEIVCQDGTYLVNLLENTISLNDKEIFSSSQSILDTYKEQIKFFLRYIKDEERGFNSLQEAYKILNLCLKE